MSSNLDPTTYKYVYKQFLETEYKVRNQNSYDKDKFISEVSRLLDALEMLKE